MLGLLVLERPWFLVEEVGGEGEKEERLEVLLRWDEGKEKPWVFATWAYRLILCFGFWMREQPMICKI